MVFTQITLTMLNLRIEVAVSGEIHVLVDDPESNQSLTHSPS